MKNKGVVKAGHQGIPGHVVVVILNYNKREYTLECIESVLKSDYARYETIVVDNASTDGSVEAVSKAYPGIPLIKSSKNLGAPGGRNLGIRYSFERLKPDYFFFLDNDTIVSPSCLSRLVVALKEDKDAAIACPKGYQEGPENRIMSAGMVVNLSRATIYDRGAGELDRGQFDKKMYVSACGGFGFLIKSEALREVGEYDEAFNPYSWEDVDLCLRLKRLGYQMLYVPSAALVHRGGKVGRGVVPMYERYKARNFIFLIRKHATFMQQVSCLIWAPLKAFRLIMRGLFLGGGHVGLPMAKGFWDAMMNRKNFDQSSK